jgi:hypothetical protein
VAFVIASQRETFAVMDLVSVLVSKLLKIVIFCRVTTRNLINRVLGAL